MSRHPLHSALTRRGAMALLALLAAGVSASGCLGGGGGGGADDGTLRLAQTAEPTTLDPAQVQDGPTIEFMMHVFEGLVQWSPENKLVPALAEKWEISPDGRTYTFTIRQGAKFHNGREVTAEDFAYSISRTLADKTSSVAEVYLNDILGAKAYREGKTQKLEGVEVVDPRTLKITIDAPKGYFLAKLTYPTAYAVCKEAVENTSTMTEQEAIGTGPFRLAEYRRGDRMILEAFPEYWDGAPKLARIERRILLDAGTRHDAFEAGDLDIADVSMAMYRADKDNPELADKLKLFPRPSIYYIALNQQAYAPFKDRRVRQAFAHAVDRNAIVQTVHEGVPQVAAGIVPTGVPGHDPDFRGLEYDPARAKQLLSEAGYPNGRGLPPLTLYFRAQVEDIRNTAQVVAEQLKNNLGLEVKLAEEEWTTFLAKRNRGEMPVYFLRWAADYLDPQNFLSLMLHSGSKENTLGYSNPEFDRLCDQADVMQDAEKRLATYRRAEEIVVSDAPWIPIHFQKDVELWNPRLRGVEDSAMGHLPHKRTHFAD
ncbi:MAG: ABC transporter substrate-binding protein [Armatimonadota bacterium]